MQMAARLADRAVQGDNLARFVDFAQSDTACIADNASADTAHGGQDDARADVLLLRKGLYAFQKVVASMQAFADGFHVCLPPKNAAARAAANIAMLLHW